MEAAVAWNLMFFGVGTLFGMCLFRYAQKGQ